MTGLARLAPARRDIWLAMVVFALSQVEVWWYGAAGGTLAGAVTLGAAGAALAWRRTAPIVTACLVVAALGACASFAGEPFSATSVISMTVTFFAIGSMSQRRRAIAALAAAMVLGLLVVVPLTLNTYLGMTLSSFVVPWLLGDAWRRHQQGRAAAERQQVAADEAVAEERLRLARELHDVVSHNVGMIAVQAGAADVLLTKDPDRSRESLRAIEDGARDTLLELRQMLGLLRDDDPDPLTSGPQLAQIERIIGPMCEAGVQVELSTVGDPVPLGSAVERTAYRIVQEALTNTVAHAGPCRVQVRITYGPDFLQVDVEDDGRGIPDSSRGGYGLVGIRERVAVLGGSIEAGRRPAGGFRVHTRLPLPAR